MSSLVDVSLGRNALTGSVPEEIGRLQSLQLLWLDHNDLSGRLPAEFALLTRMKNLRLHDNDQLTGSLNDLCKRLDDQDLPLSNFVTNCVNIYCPCCECDLSY
jgi:Leucine-rich repeat (LRR) protein